MMLYSREGKLVTRENKLIERKINTLTFKVKGTQFPDIGGFDPTDGRILFYFDSITKNSVTVNWGDGESDVYFFGTDTGNNRLGWTGDGKASASNILVGDSIAPPHIYSDDFTGERLITFQFEKLEEIIFHKSSFIRLSSYPFEIGFAKKMKKIEVSFAFNILKIPESIIKNKDITEVSFNTSFTNRLTSIPDGFFSNPLKTFRLGSCLDLSGGVETNFFKIGLLSSTLEFLDFSDSSINNLPSTLADCKKLTNLYLSTNPIQNLSLVSSLYNLYELHIDFDSTTETLFDTSQLDKLRSFWSRGLQEFQILDIPSKWTGLKSFKTVGFFPSVIKNYDNVKFDLFIDNFYELCTVNGFLEPTSAEATATGYPDQFRDISWGHSGYTQTGAIQAPAGFVQGISNGDLPMTQGEKIYVLVNNYGHNVTTSGNFN